MARIMIEDPGLMTTVQDAGRFGYQRYGMPVSGAMDGFALLLANMLAGNRPDEACLEATVSGPALVFGGSCLLAIAGADMKAVLNGTPVACNRSYRVQAGDRLHFEGLAWGCRTYIACSGGLDVPLIMGSRSTCLVAKLGGYQGRPLQRGDVIALKNTDDILKEREAPVSLTASVYHSGPVQIIPGPEAKCLSTKGVISLLSTAFTISAQSNRMGYRLQGATVALEEPAGHNISAGVPLGTVQLAGDGQPIILMADHQTTGGYARIAIVTSADLPRLAQMPAGTELSFEETDISAAQKKIRERYQALQAWHNSLPK